MSNQFGIKIRQLREEQGLLLREVAPKLAMDTPLLSKIERGERVIKKELISKICKIYSANKSELQTLWLADQIVEVIKDDENALQAMIVAEDTVKYNGKINQKKNDK